MQILDRILPARRDAQVNDLAWRVASDQHQCAWQQLVARAGLLSSVSEARGYIRCRVTPVLRSGLRRLANPTLKLTPRMQDRIIDRALELIVGRFAGRMVKTAPAMKQSRRAA